MAASLSPSGSQGRPGFATLAVALLLAAAGALALLLHFAPGAPTDLRETQESLRRMARVDRALRAYASREGRLPCPAEVGGGGAEGACVAAGGAVVGLVPHAALDLSASEGEDAWGRHLTYAVSPAFTAEDSWVSGAVGGLAVDAGWAADDPTAPARRDEGLAWVLVSHGANGLGAVLPSGARLEAPPSEGERANLGRSPDGAPALFRKAPHALDLSVGDGFDDLLWEGWPP